MPVFHSPKYKELRVADLGLRFKGGVLEVEEGAQADRLRGLASFGVIEAEAAQESASDGGPADGEQDPGGSTSEEDAKPEVPSPDASEPAKATGQPKRRSRTS
jgi:hypothetical protein